jgi:hypothetical protein
VRTSSNLSTRATGDDLEIAELVAGTIKPGS